jgi:murein DD-endopeptidase
MFAPLDRTLALLAVVLLTLLSERSESRGKPPPSPSRESFDIAVPVPPSPVTIEGREWLVYELHLTNFTSEPLRIERVHVIGDGVLADIRVVNEVVPPRERAVVYLEVMTAARTLGHIVGYGGQLAVVAADVAVRPKATLALGAPLRGGPWAAVYAWEWPRGHRRVFYTLDGRARLPGRLAIDFVRKDERGRSARGDADVVANSLGYGADVLAVADARVAEVRDGLLEAGRVSANPRHPLDDKAGNFVALDLGDGRFAVYEHLKPGSIRVKRGDRVRRGETIAALGFTGDSTEPHLHFHVADSPWPLAGEGLPFEFEMEGARERPAPNALVTFPPGPD